MDASVPRVRVYGLSQAAAIVYVPARFGCGSRQGVASFMAVGVSHE